MVLPNSKQNEQGEILGIRSKRERKIKDCTLHHVHLSVQRKGVGA